MGRQFPPPGAKDVPSYERILNVVFNIHMTGSLNQLEIVFLSEGVARAAVAWALPGARMGLGFPASSTTRASGAVHGGGPLSAGGVRATREGEMVEGATLVFTPLGAARTGDDICAPICALFIPIFGGSLPPQ